MASLPIRILPEAGAAAEPWPADEVTIRVDEMFARRLDTEFASGVRGLLHDPETGLSSLSGEAALEAIAGVYPALQELRQRTLSEAIGPRQRALVEPAIDARLDWAAGTIGRLAERATVEVDDASVAERIAGLRQDAETSWHDPAWLRKLGRTTVTELRWQGERRGWDESATDARTRAGLSDLYAGAVEAAIGRDLDGAANLLAHARAAIDPARLETIDRSLARAREDGFLREVDAALATLPLDPTTPPALDVFTTRTTELTPEDATDEVRGRLGELALHAQRRAERQWHRRQAEAGIAALDWLKQNPDASSLFLPDEVREWLAPDQLDGLRTMEQRGRFLTDPDLFWRLERLSVYEPEAFAAFDLDRHRLSLDDADHARLVGWQKAIAEDAADPAFARHLWARIGLDRALAAEGIDTEGGTALEADRDRSVIEDDIEDAGDAEPAEAPPPSEDREVFNDSDRLPAGGDRADDPDVILANGGNARRGSGPRDPALTEAMRREVYRSHREALERLEPNNPFLTSVGAPGGIPDRAAVARLHQELQAARARAAGGPLPAPGGSLTPSGDGPLLPGGGRLERPLGIPRDWQVMMSKKGGGVIYINPNNPGDQVRVMPGDPSSPYPHRQRPYVVDQNWGAFVSRDGQSIGGARPGREPDAHIPYDVYFFWR